MSVCALIGAADFNAQHFSLQKYDCVVAVDAGYCHLEKLAYVPDHVIGDFDSLGFVPDHPSVEKHPSQKDAPDIELAMTWAIHQGFDTLVLYGCLGGRLDMTYAVQQLLAQFAQKGFRVSAIGAETAIVALDSTAQNTLSFSEEAQGSISVFAVCGKATKVNEVGLAYCLDNATIYDMQVLGVSNEFVGEKATISVGLGTLLVFFDSSETSQLLS